MALNMNRDYCFGKCGHIRDCHTYHWPLTFDRDGIICDNFTDDAERERLFAEWEKETERKVIEYAVTASDVELKYPQIIESIE